MKTFIKLNKFPHGVLKTTGIGTYSNPLLKDVILWDYLHTEGRHICLQNRMGKKVRNITVSQVMKNSGERGRLGPVLLDFEHAPCLAENLSKAQVTRSLV
jgi:hypothetical protein